MTYPFYGTPVEQAQQARDNYWGGANDNESRWGKMGFVGGRPARDPHRKWEPVILPPHLISPPPTEAKVVATEIGKTEP